MAENPLALAGGNLLILLFRGRDTNNLVPRDNNHLKVLMDPPKLDNLR